ncbi:unnamed protein product, partial [Medioppia subpectinata]
MSKSLTKLTTTADNSPLNTSHNQTANTSTIGHIRSGQSSAVTKPVANVVAGSHLAANTCHMNTTQTNTRKRLRREAVTEVGGQSSAGRSRKVEAEWRPKRRKYNIDDDSESDSDIEIVAIVDAPTAQTTGAATAGPSEPSPPPVLPSVPPPSAAAVDTAIQSLAVTQTAPNEGRQQYVESDTTSPTITPVASDMDMDSDDSVELLDPSDDDLYPDAHYSDSLPADETTEALPDSDYYDRFDSLVERVSGLLGPDVKPVIGAAGDVDIKPDRVLNACSAPGDSLPPIAALPVVEQSNIVVSVTTDLTLADVKPLLTDPSLQTLSEQSLDTTLSTQIKNTDSVQPVMTANTNHKNSDTNTYSEESMLKHTVVSDKQQQFVCDRADCGQSFGRETQLYAHKRDDHTNHVQQTPASLIVTVPLAYRCQYERCGQRFASQSALDDHNEDKHSGDYHKCDVEDCGQSVVTESLLNHHKLSDHLLPEPDLNPPLSDQSVPKTVSTVYLYECDYKECFGMFATEEIMMKHKRAVHQKHDQLLIAAQELSRPSVNNTESQTLPVLSDEDNGSAVSVVNTFNGDVSADGLRLVDIPVPTPATAENSSRLWDTLLRVGTHPPAMTVTLNHPDMSDVIPDTIPALDTVLSAGDKSPTGPLVPPPLPPPSLLTVGLDVPGNAGAVEDNTTSRSGHTVAYSPKTIITYSEKRYKCDKCSQTYLLKAELNRHQKDKHGASDKSPTRRLIRPPSPSPPPPTIGLSEPIVSSMAVLSELSSISSEDTYH